MWDSGRGGGVGGNWATEKRWGVGARRKCRWQKCPKKVQLSLDCLSAQHPQEGVTVVDDHPLPHPGSSPQTAVPHHLTGEREEKYKSIPMKLKCPCSLSVGGRLRGRCRMGSFWRWFGLSTVGRGQSSKMTSKRRSAQAHLAGWLRKSSAYLGYRCVTYTMRAVSEMTLNVPSKSGCLFSIVLNPVSMPHYFSVSDGERKDQKWRFPRLGIPKLT